MEKGGVSGVVADSEEVEGWVEEVGLAEVETAAAGEMAVGATVEGTDWEVEDLAAAAEKWFRI
jgi:hypothetical protein